MESPFSSTSIGTVPAGFRSRNSGRRSHIRSTLSSNGSRFSDNTRRTLRENGDNGRWCRIRMATRRYVIRRTIVRLMGPV